MKIKIRKNRCFLIVIGSWLMAKLWWTFEISRLAFYRAIPGKKINHIVYASKLPPNSEWSYEDDKFSVMHFDNKNNTFVIYKLPEMSKN